jgi:hypothetical protein
MNRLPHSRPRRRLALLAVAFGLSVMAASAAQAFTIDDQSNTTSNGAARYADPDSRFSNSSTGSNGQSVYKSGNMTFQFGNQRPTSDSRYNTDRMFNPNGRPGDDR